VHLTVNEQAEQQNDDSSPRTSAIVKHNNYKVQAKNTVFGYMIKEIYWNYT
jgi:hypothetical protein